MCLNIQGYIQPSYPYLLYIFFRPFELENAVQSSPGPVIKPPEPLHQLQLHIQATSTSRSVGIPSQSHWQPVAGRQLAVTVRDIPVQVENWSQPYSESVSFPSQNPGWQ